MDKKPKIISLPQSIDFIAEIVGNDLHAKRILSLAGAAVGVIHAGSLGVHAIGRGLAAVEGKTDKHTIKQVDRLLSNKGLDFRAVERHWVRWVVGARKALIVNMDWTDFDADGQEMIVLSLQTDHGRATPLVWLTVRDADLKGSQFRFETEVLMRLAEAIDPDVAVTIVADRGFGDVDRYQSIWELNFHYVIRFRGNINVVAADGEKRTAHAWTGANGQLKVLHNAQVTAALYPVPIVVCVRDPDMKAGWFLASNLPDVTGRDVVKIYGKRFTTEETFRDAKDLRFGMGLGWQKVGDPQRRDRLFLLAALAHGLLTLLGAAGEAAGLDRLLKSNTSKTRQLSLFRQGLRWYDLIPNMPEPRLQLLIEHFAAEINKHAVFQEILGRI